ncbi:hypothetical protein QJ857_gp1302 [Tupanvirus soda lake]|uniref:Uncharacterized protein n=2 Tax=Tupanvirus TaxID=2094720 RepID=A0A6N1NKA4_9VIRU|nr:hypothetical protein QJ857_gp1302 [Tupanvirus soda lake]QKU34760.1 hypothetical protein [Tupanvirus soda lake]
MSTTTPILATYNLSSSWSTGYQISITVKNNTQNPTTGWTVTFQIPLNVKVSSSWNCVLTQNGQTITAKNAAHNAVIKPGSSTNFGVQFTKPSTAANTISNLQAVGTFSNPTPNPTPDPTPNPTPTPSPSGKIIEGYWESWDSKVPVNTIVNMKANLIDISFGTFTQTGINTFVVSGVEASSSTINQLVTAAHSLGKKVKLSIGGATYPISKFLTSDAAAQGLAQAVANYVKTFSLDGVDYDIEDRPAVNLQIALIKYTRQILGSNYLISYTAMSPASTTSPWSNVIYGAHTYLNTVSIMAYNYGPGYTFQQDVQNLIGKGVPASKIVVGLMPGRDDVGVLTDLNHIRTAANYIKQYNLAGIMFWSLNRDFSNLTGLGSSAATNTAYSILG